MSSRFDTAAARTLRGASSYVSVSLRPIVRLFSITLTAGALAACAQSSVVSKSELRAAVRRAPSLDKRKTAMTAGSHAANTKKHLSFATNKRTAVTKVAAYGIASFYRYDSQTANGEKFDPQKLTAAHRTLPFGTRLRVTDVATGRSVTVRVNDRGPFVPGRVIDLSYSAAEKLGIVGRGVARVKLAVVQ
jgi:rare lipoprotein A